MFSNCREVWCPWMTVNRNWTVVWNEVEQLWREKTLSVNISWHVCVWTWKPRTGPVDKSINLVFSKWKQCSLEREGAMWQTASVQQVPRSQIRPCGECWTLLRAMEDREASLQMSRSHQLETRGRRRSSQTPLLSEQEPGNAGVWSEDKQQKPARNWQAITVLAWGLQLGLKEQSCVLTEAQETDIYVQPWWRGKLPGRSIG